MRRTLENRNGFTLIEVLIAAAIFVFAMAGILQMFTRCALLDQANRNKSIAAIHAGIVMENVMDFMRASELSTLQTQVTAGTWHWDSSTTPTLGAYLGCDGPPYAYPCVLGSESITTAYSDADPVNNPPVITVTVGWKDKAQLNERELELNTHIAKR